MRPTRSPTTSWDLMKNGVWLTLFTTKLVLEREQYLRFTWQLLLVLTFWPFLVYYVPVGLLSSLRWILLFPEDPLNFLYPFLVITDATLAFWKWLSTYIMAAVYCWQLVLLFFISLARFKHRQRSIISLRNMLIELLLIFTFVYLFLALFSPEAQYHFNGMPWIGTTLEQWVEDPLGYFKVLAYSFYVSVSALATVGMGNLTQASSLALLLTSLEALASFFIVITIATAKK